MLTTPSDSNDHAHNALLDCSWWLPSHHASSGGTFAGLADPLDCLSQAAFRTGGDALSHSLQNLCDTCPARGLSAGNLSLVPAYILMWMTHVGTPWWHCRVSVPNWRNICSSLHSEKVGRDIRSSGMLLVQGINKAVTKWAMQWSFPQG